MENRERRREGKKSSLKIFFRSIPILLQNSKKRMLEIFHENSLRVWEEFYFPTHPKTFHGFYYYYKTCNNITHLWLSKVYYMTVCWSQHIDSSFTAFKVGCKSEKPTSQKNFGEEYTSHGNSIFMGVEYCWILNRGGQVEVVAIRSRVQ